MKCRINSILAALALMGLVSCTANYENINSNPYQPGDLSADDYALGAAMSSLAGCVISADVNTTQFTDCLLGGTTGGYFADANSGWTATISNYNPTDDWSRVFLKTDQIIPVLYTNLSTIATVAEQTDNPVITAIGDIMKVACMHRVCDTFGPIPYSQIGSDGSITTPYDSEEKVYTKFFEELNDAIDVLTEHRTEALVSTADYVYYGDVELWVKYANSLKLRLAMRIATVSPTVSKQMAEEAVSHEIGVMTSNSDNAQWNYFGTTQNPLYVAVNYNRVTTHSATDSDVTLGTSCASTGDTHAAADIICYMNGYSDPRRSAYFTESEWSGYDYVGLRRGITIPDHATVGHKYSGPNISSSDPLIWMTAAEVSFLCAEAVAIYGYDMGDTAENFYNNGIELSFDQWGASGAASYIADNSSVPTTYTDPAGSNSYSSTISTITIAWDDSATATEKQERIITQKWIAMWPLGTEAWADYRRTGYPHLIPATTAGNKSNGVVDSSRGARRMPYPLDEYVSNSTNVTYAVANYLNGPDNMATDIWWATTD